MIEDVAPGRILTTDVRPVGPDDFQRHPHHRGCREADRPVWREATPMNRRPEPDDVDLFVGGVAPAVGASVETARFIEEYKKRPDYPLEAADAERVLAALGIDPRDDGRPDARSLLEHWHGCVAAWRKTGPGASHGTDADGEDLGIRPGLPGESRA